MQLFAAGKCSILLIFNIFAKRQVPESPEGEKGSGWANLVEGT
jgi:hypothetical protein